MVRKSWFWPWGSPRERASPGLKLRHTLRSHQALSHRISWSPDGRYVAAGSAYGARIWDAETGKIVRDLSDFEGPGLSIAWSPDGLRLACAPPRPDGRTGSYWIGVWDVQTGDTIWKRRQGDHLARVTSSGSSGYDPYGEWVNHLAWAPDGKTLALAVRNKTVRLLHAENGKSIQTLNDCAGYLSAVAWSPDGEILASAGSDSVVLSDSVRLSKPIQLWDPHSGKLLQTIEGAGSSVIAWVPGNSSRRLAYVANDNSMRIWDFGTGQTAIVFHGHTAPATAVAFSSDGRLLASKGRSANDCLRIWCTDTSQQLATITASDDEECSEPGLAFHAHRPLLATLVSGQQLVRIWEIDHSVLSTRSATI